LVRTDLPLTTQIVQVGHACLEAGFKFSKLDEIINLVLLDVATEAHLLATFDEISIKGIQAVMFYEPDNHLGFTAICTEPLDRYFRHEFRAFQLWKPSREVIDT
jgi:hypothetical protein